VRTFARDSEDSGYLDSLIRGPFVEVGRAVHKSLEIADGALNIEDVFYDTIRAREAELQVNQRRKHYSNLRESVGQDRWNERLEIVKSHRGPDAPVEIHETGSASGAQRLNPAMFKSPSEWVELYVVSDELLLSGQIDRLEMLMDGVVRIVDYKTGEVLDENGNAKREYVMQLAAYEAICRGYWPNAQFELVLDNGAEFRVAIDDAIRDELRQKLLSLQSSIGSLAGQQIMSQSYETLSGGCLDCPIRHTCNAYRAALRDDSLKEIVAEEWQVSNLVVGNQIAFFGFTAQRNKNKATGTETAPFGYSDSFRNSRNWNAEIFLA
jgi:hypothetical protein